MPLGAFIKPSQEKTACDGKRPFHMCSMMKAPVKKSPPPGVSIQSASSTARSAVSSAGVSDKLWIKAHAAVYPDFAAPLYEAYKFFPVTPSIYRLDAVPKA